MYGPTLQITDFPAPDPEAIANLNTNFRQQPASQEGAGLSGKSAVSRHFSRWLSGAYSSELWGIISMEVLAISAVWISKFEGPWGRN
jgi:hypothetical protein